MRKIFIFIFALVFTFSLKAQELNCLVTINDDQVAGSNKQVFRTLEKALSEFINQTEWTNKKVTNEERINAALNIIITKRDNNNFEGTLQIQSTRPIFGSSYETPVLNIKDNDFKFRYNEFDPLIYNPNSFDSNLISTIVFYVYVIIGVDADTFALNGGEASLKQAENAMLQAQQSGLSAWQNQVGRQNRFLLIDNILSDKLKAYRTAMYNYHRKGLDNFSSNKSQAKQAIEDAVISLESLFNKTIGNYLVRTFFDAKADEIVNVYSDGPKTKSVGKLISTLRKISNNNNNKWGKIN